MLLTSIHCFSYRFEDRSHLGPDYVPVSKSFARAKDRHEKVNARRVELITLNTPLVASYQSELENEKAILKTREAQAQSKDELDKILETEVSFWPIKFL